MGKSRPTVKQRLKIYKKALKLLPMHPGICDLLKYCHSATTANTILKNFPEFAMHQPNNKGVCNHWWPVATEEGREIRKSCLEWCIRMCEEQLHQKRKNQN